ncbi:MAG TPA: arylamine N-acetyltransferase [Opitutaceae bacterium]|nr:arylamine N-acetyltransferase [Opitutaceae bacterium]
MSPADLDAYFARIGYAGPREVTRPVLAAIQARHVQAIPFENIDVLHGKAISLAPEVLQAKLVAGGRGGYCFEQNTLLAGVLRALGFEVTPLLARVRRNAPPDLRTPLTHLVLRVDLDGRPWLVDVGFGSVGPTAPIALDSAVEQASPHEPRRLLRLGDRLMHQARLGDEWVDVYEFTLEPQAPLDFELGNWFSCTHPKAHFRNNLVVTRVDGPRRHILFNHEYVVRELDGRAEKRPVTSRADLLALLAGPFGLRLPRDTRIDWPTASWTD